MNKNITIIDREEGTGTNGYAIRVGARLDDRLANCFNAETNGLFKYGSTEYTYWNSFSNVYAVALELQKNLYPTYKVRIDCTVVG